MPATQSIKLIFVLVCLLFCSLSGSGQEQGQNTSITLHDEKLNFTPHEFYISDVVDERDSKSPVASLIQKSVDKAPVVKQVDLKGGTAISVRNFLFRNLTRDTSLRPVILSIKEFKITETGLPGGRVNGHLAIVFSFALQQNYSTAHLIDYKAGLKYNRPDGAPSDVEAILRQGLVDALSWFNTWINSHADNYSLLARAVKVKFTDYTESPEGDTIYYSAKRPLTWADFKDSPRADRFEAEVFTSIGYTERNEVVKGVIHVNIAMKVDLPKNDCWVRPGGRDDYVLNHEQRHFDIEKLVSEHFKKKILAMHLPVNNYDGPINVEYLETLREATAMQKQYDKDTRHGENKQAQELWNEKIDAELRSYGLEK